MSSPDSRTASGFMRHVLSYGTVTVVHKFLGLAMLPFYTLWLSESEYGAIGITDLVLVFLIEVFGRHLLAGMSRHYFLASEERGARAVISSTTILVMVASWVVCGIAFLFHDELVPLLLGQGDSSVGHERLSRLLTLTLLVLPCTLTSQAGFSYLLIRKQSKVWAIVQLSKTFLELGLKIVLVGVMGRGVEGFLMSVLVGEALTAVFLTGTVLRRVGLHLDRRALLPVVRFALPLLPVGAFQLGLHMLDRRLVEHLAPGELGLTWAGIYSLGYLLGSTPASVFLNAIFAAWQPSIYAIKDHEERARRHARDTTWAVLALAGICAFACLAGRPLVNLLSGQEGYKVAYRVIPWVACAYVFWGLYAAIQLSFYSAQKTGALIAVNLAALVVNVAANYLLIPRYGYVGAGAATLLAFAILAAAAALIGRRVCPVPFESGRILAALGLTLVAGATGIWVDSATADLALAASLGARTALMGCFAAVLLGPMLRPEERALLRSSAAHAWQRVRGRSSSG